jgi:hypothetical protein
MVVSTQNQQIKFGKPTESRLILQDAIWSVSNQSFVQFCSPIAKFNNISSDNSMSTVGMEFFVPAARVLVNASKQDQVPASF